MATLQELQKQLKSVIAERDALAKDVESLCLASAPGSGSMFAGPSYVLSEQLKGVTKELLAAREALRSCQHDKEEALQEGTAARAAQVAIEEKLASTKHELTVLKGEKEYFQASVARCTLDLDQQGQELISLRTKLAETEVMLGKAEDHAVTESKARREAEAALASKQQQLAQARNEMESRKSELSNNVRQLSTTKAACMKLEAALAALQARLDSTGEELEQTRGALQGAREAEGQLRVQLQESQALIARLQGTTNGQSEQLAALSQELTSLQATSSSELAQLKASQASLLQELEAAKEQVVELSQDLRQARQEASRAEQLLSEHRQAAHQQATSCALSAAEVQPDEAGTNSADATGQENGSTQEEQLNKGVTVMGDTSGAAAGAARDAADAAEQLIILRTMVHDLKVKLAQATQEKVQALLAMADLKQAANAAADQAAAAAKRASNPHHHQHTHSLPAGIPVPQQGRSPAAASTSVSGAPGPEGSSPQSSSSGFAAYMTSRLAASLGGFKTSAALKLPGASSTPSTSGAAAATGAEATGQQQGSSSSGSAGGDALAGGAPAPSTNALGTPGAGGDVQGLLSPRHTSSASPAGGKQQAEGASRVSEGGQAAASLQHHSSGSDTGGLAAAAVQHLVAESEGYLKGLKAAARTILASDASAAVKWSALTGLSQLHMQLNRTRARMGLPRPTNPFDDSPAVPMAGSEHKPKGGANPLEASITAKVLDLVDLSLTCLEQYNRREALSTLNQHPVS